MKLKKCWFRERVNNTEAITNQEVTKMGKDGQDLQRLKMRSSTATKSDLPRCSELFVETCKITFIVEETIHN